MLHPYPGELEFDGSNPSYCLNILPSASVVCFSLTSLYGSLEISFIFYKKEELD